MLSLPTNSHWCGGQCLAPTISYGLSQTDSARCATSTRACPCHWPLPVLQGILESKKEPQGAFLSSLTPKARRPCSPVFFLRVTTKSLRTLLLNRTDSGLRQPLQATIPKRQ